MISRSSEVTNNPLNRGTDVASLRFGNFGGETSLKRVEDDDSKISPGCDANRPAGAVFGGGKAKRLPCAAVERVGADFTLLAFGGCDQGMTDSGSIGASETLLPRHDLALATVDARDAAAAPAAEFDGKAADAFFEASMH